jgi:phosphoribosylaminoimidazole-succinocarboxamide synthase
VRSWVAARCDPYKDPIPPIPAEIVLATAEVYIKAFERITGQQFTPPPADPPLDRIRRNLANYL